MRSVRTTLQVLEAVGDGQPIGLSDLARQLELPKSTVQRSLSTLADAGWIRPAGHGAGRWALSGKVRLLSEKVDDLGRLREAAMPVMNRLNRSTLEAIHLAVPESGTVRLVERLESSYELRLVRPIGVRSPLHASSNGKCILAHLPDSDVEAYIANGLSAIKRTTITEPHAMWLEIARIREQGYAVSREELLDGVVSVAACIHPPDGRPVASLSISGVGVRMTDRLCVQYGEMVSAAAKEVSDLFFGDA